MATLAGWRLLRTLHNDGALLPGLSIVQFFLVIVASVLGVVGIIHLVHRRLAAGERKQPQA